MKQERDGLVARASNRQKRIAHATSLILYDRIAWTAARVILTRIRNDPGYEQLDPELRLSLETFLVRHPVAMEGSK